MAVVAVVPVVPVVCRLVALLCLFGLIRSEAALVAAGTFSLLVVFRRKLVSSRPKSIVAVLQGAAGAPVGDLDCSCRSGPSVRRYSVNRPCDEGHLSRLRKDRRRACQQTEGRAAFVCVSRCSFVAAPSFARACGHICVTSFQVESPASSTSNDEQCGTPWGRRGGNHSRRLGETVSFGLAASRPR